MDNNGQNLSGQMDAKKKDFSVVDFQPIEVKQAATASAADAGKIKKYMLIQSCVMLVTLSISLSCTVCMYVCMYVHRRIES